MNRKIAVIFFLSVCLILAALLLTKTINSTTSGITFAIALVLFGILSKGFQSGKNSSKPEDSDTA